MYEILDLIARLPKAAKAVMVFFLVIPVSYVFARLLGVEKYWWVFALGMLAIIGLIVLFNTLVKARDRKQGSAFEGELRQDAQRGASKDEVRQALGEVHAADLGVEARHLSDHGFLERTRARGEADSGVGARLLPVHRAFGR